MGVMSSKVSRPAFEGGFFAGVMSPAYFRGPNDFKKVSRQAMCNTRFSVLSSCKAADLAFFVVLDALCTCVVPTHAL